MRKYEIKQTEEAVNDAANIRNYLSYTLKNSLAAIRFLQNFDKSTDVLAFFPYTYKGIGYFYRDIEIRMKNYDSYNIFYAIDENEKQILILRVLNERQDWNWIFGKHR